MTGAGKSGVSDMTSRGQSVEMPGYRTSRTGKSYRRLLLRRPVVARGSTLGARQGFAVWPLAPAARVTFILLAARFWQCAQ